MGLMLHSLEGLNDAYERDYYVYILDYGWEEPVSRILKDNFSRMARMSSENKKSVVITGTPDAMHFGDEVLSWHNINGADPENSNLLPAIMVTNRHPMYFRERANGGKDVDPEMKMILVPFRKISTDPNEVVRIINGIFDDLKENRDLDNFRISKEMKKGKGDALVDAVVLEPNFMGIGLDLKKLKRFLLKET